MIHLSSPTTDCAVCSENYAMGVSNTCEKCPEGNGDIALMVVTGFIAAVLGVALCVGVIWHLVSRETDYARQGMVACVKKHLPLQALKIVIVVWQILTQVRFSS